MSREIIVYADESDKDGPYFANFYGGAAVESVHLREVEDRLNQVKSENNLFREIKWQKVTENYLGKYMAVIDEVFRLLAEDKLKIRVLFTQRAIKPINLLPYHHEHEFHILYYQFLKFGFGLEHSNPSAADPVRIRYYLDDLPDTREKNRLFKGFIASLEQYPPFRRAGIKIPLDQIAEVDSHNHVILQCVDIVLGAIQFRLNDKHKLKGPNGRRAKKTIAKEKLYKHVLGNIRALYPGFNIGISTGLRGDHANRWLDPYRHWCFRPAEFEYDESKTKPK